MKERTAPPSGLSHRRRRLSDEETERRMLDAALAMVNRSGLTVSLEHISFEDVIRDAGVSRSAVYRRWPYKDLFFSDLLRELSHGAGPSAFEGPDRTQEQLARLVAAHRDRLGTAEGRRDVVTELIRQGALLDFAAIRGSTAWRTYLALHATFLSLPDGELREQVGAGLARAEQGFVGRIARSWQQLTQALGYRLRAGWGGGYDTVARLVSASLRGMVVMSLADPELADVRLPADPAGTGTTVEWSLTGLSAAAVALAFFEPDPTVEWDESRTAALLDLLDSPLPA